jgi:nuclear pore complex protein Nup205
MNINQFSFNFQALRTLIQGRQGITWTLGTSIEVTELITSYTEELLEQGLVDKIISKKKLIILLSLLEQI